MSACNNSQSRFSQLAQKAMETSAQFADATIELSKEQKALVDAYSKAKAALDDKAESFRSGYKAQLQMLEDVLQEQLKQVAQEKANLKQEFEKEAVTCGLKKENIPLAEYRVVKAADDLAVKAATAAAIVQNGLKDIWNRAKQNASKK